MELNVYQEPNVCRALSCAEVRVCLSVHVSVDSKQHWHQRREKRTSKVIGESEAFCLNLQLQTHPGKEAHGLNVFCFFELFDFLKWIDNAAAMLDFAYRPVSGSYRPHPPPLTCGTVRRADTVKSPFMNHSAWKLMAYKGLGSLQQR